MRERATLRKGIVNEGPDLGNCRRGSVGASLFATRRRVQEIYTQLDAINVRHREVEGTLRRLRGDFHVSGIFVRDYLLDTSRSASPEYREELSALRAHTGTNLAALERLVPGGETPRIQRLKAK